MYIKPISRIFLHRNQLDQDERQTGQQGHKGDALDAAEVDDDGGQAGAERTAQLDQGTVDAEHETGFVFGHLGRCRC